MVDWQQLLFGEFRFVLGAIALLVGLLLGFVVGKLSARVLTAAGVPDAVEGTSFERTARSLGTSTVGLFSRMTAWFIYGVTILVALHVAELLPAQLFLLQATGFVPGLFLAIIVLAVGFVAADKAELVVSERLRGVKVPELGLLPKVVKYSVVFVALLVALGQIGVEVAALLVMLGAYLFAVIVFTAMALRDLLTASAAGIYLLLTQPYSIGDRVTIGEHTGIVQEVDVLTTHIEDDNREYIVPNHLVLRHGATRVRDY